MITLFVSCIDKQASEGDIRSFFVEGGYEPNSTRLAMDGYQSRGFAFLEFQDREFGLKAIGDMDGQEFMGRRLNVRESVESKSQRYAPRLRPPVQAPAGRQ